MDNEQVSEQETGASIPDGFIEKSKVNDIVHARTKDVHAKAYEKGKQDALAAMQQQQPVTQASGSQQSMGGMTTPSSEDIQKMINDGVQNGLQNLQHHADAQRIASNFMEKLKPGYDNDPDFEKKVNALNLHQNLPLMHLLSGVDNTHEVIQDLHSNPIKIGNIMSLVNSPMAHMAPQAMASLANSIKMNNQASDNVKVPNAPLNQLQHSNVQDNGARTISDMRRDPRFRG